MARQWVDQTRVFARFLHEIRHPVVAIRAVAEMLQRDLAEKNVQLEHDYVEDILSWSEVLVSEIARADVIAKCEAHGALRCQLHSARLRHDVVLPAVRRIRPLLARREFSPTAIHTDGLNHLPQLRLDQPLMKLAFVQLLGNAIEYAYPDPSAFRIEVVGDRSEEGYLILFRDYGQGIPEEWDARIFEQGARGSDPELRISSGAGLGLWIVREVFLAHGGAVDVSHRKAPTEFRLMLPASLANAPQRGIG